MRYSRQHAEHTAELIRDAARRGFRASGYGGLSVDTIAKAAGVTSGAFYKHFSSKSEAFRAIAEEGLACVRQTVTGMQRKHPKDWALRFARFYLSQPSADCDPEDASLPIQGGCALPTLSPEVVRCDLETREGYERELSELLNAIASGLGGPKSKVRATAWAYLSLLTGAIVLGRATSSERTRREILQSALRAATQLLEHASTSTTG